MNLRRRTVSASRLFVAVAGVAALLSLAQPALGRQATPVDDSGRLFAVSAVSPTDVWAVGELYPSFLPVMRHFDGTGWTDVAVPHPKQGSALFGVSADASDDAWAVGYYYDGSALHNLTLHWDGEKWRRVHSVPGEGPSPYLSAVSADSPTDAWAVGQSLAEHWDGTSWTRFEIPAKMWCYGVVAISPTDAWIVGIYKHATATLHWDGVTLTQVSSPNGRLRDSSFGAVAAASSNDVWAVGASYKGDGKRALTGGERAFTGVWDGNSWTGRSPVPHLKDLVLDAVAVSSPTLAWAGGTIDNGHPYLLRWDGTSWSPVDMPATDYASIDGLSADSPTDAWAVGYQNSGPLIWHWDGASWSQVE